jgi:hypothetical protein
MIVVMKMLGELTVLESVIVFMETVLEVLTVQENVQLVNQLILDQFVMLHALVLMESVLKE